MKQWLESLKLAVLNEDIQTLEQLATSMPATQDVALMDEATSLLKEGVALCQNKQDELEVEMFKLKSVKKYLKNQI